MVNQLEDETNTLLKKTLLPSSLSSSNGSSFRLLISDIVITFGNQSNNMSQQKNED